VTPEARAAVFSALGDPIRLRIVDIVAAARCCVCEIQQQIDVAPNLLSYHLRVLREAGLVESSRRGRWVDYQLTPGAGRLIGSALPPRMDPGGTW
jgi:ArsR family transcriptional regulator